MTPWTRQVVLQLRALWAEGLTTSEIGRRLGVSKNAVVGKAHRLDLPSRPQPCPTRSYPEATHCGRGHRLVGANLSFTPDWSRWRCRSCERIRQAKRMARMRAEAVAA